jgi:hypothetical protein
MPDKTSRYTTLNEWSKQLPRNAGLWCIYILLLAVLLPHTAWMFQQGEASESAGGTVIAWAAALVFELVILAMTHRFSEHLAGTKGREYKNDWQKIADKYVNSLAFGALLAWFVSAYANVAHAIEFGNTGIKIFTAWPWVPAWSYPVAFGAVLPTASLLFAWVLSKQDDEAQQADPEVLTYLKEQRDISEARLAEANNLLDEGRAEHRQLQQAHDALQKRAAELEAQVKAIPAWELLPKTKQAQLIAALTEGELSKADLARALGADVSTVSRAIKGVNGKGE